MPAEKGTYRSIYSAIWDDPEFQEFAPLTQTVFLCLRTFKECNFPCIFVFYPEDLYKRMPKVPRPSIDEGIEELVKDAWIAYEKPVLWIVKGFRNEPNRVPKNSKQIAGVVAILKSLPKLKIVEDFAKYYDIPFKYQDTPAPVKLCSWNGCGMKSTITISGKGYCDNAEHRAGAFG